MSTYDGCSSPTSTIAALAQRVAGSGRAASVAGKKFAFIVILLSISKALVILLVLAQGFPRPGAESSVLFRYALAANFSARINILFICVSSITLFLT